LVRCERAARDRKLPVLVCSPQDTPVAGAKVFLSTDTGQRETATTDEAGRALFANLAAREFGVSVSFQDRDYVPPAPTRIVPDGQELRLVCRTATRITGTVVGEDGTVVAAGSITATRGGRFAGWAVVDSEGRFTLLLPSEETAPVRLEVGRRPPGGSAPSLDGVFPGTQDVRIVVKK
jgi:hypothetical protein